MKVADRCDGTHKPSGKARWVSRLRENLTSGSDGEGLETDRNLSSAPRQSFTRQLRFRDIKTTMGMEMLRTKSPEMLRKEILMHMIAYNLIRLLMLKAARSCGGSHRRISFKGVIQVMEESVSGFESQGNHPRILERERINLYARIAERVIPDRPGRNEPRKKKRRPKSYGWLQRPRHEYFEYYRNPAPAPRILDEVA